MSTSRTMVLAAAIAMTLTACGSSDGALTSSAIHGSKPEEKKLDPSLCDPDEQSDFTLESTNPYFPLGVGSQWVLEGEEDGDEVQVVITVLEDTELVAGVETHVVEERESVDGEIEEISLNYFVAREDGTVCYFGEAHVDEEGNVIPDAPGSWRADDPESAPGIIMPADPFPGVKFQMEDAPGAQDTGKIVGIGPVSVLGDEPDDAIRVEERNPLDGDLGFKIYVKGIGLVVDETLVLVSVDIPN